MSAVRPVLTRRRLTAMAALAAAFVVAPVANGDAAVSGRPSTTPASNTPTLVPGSTVAQVRQLVQCGSRMYAVGTFTQVAHGSTTYSRDNAFSFAASSPYSVTSWNPKVNGTVNTIAFNGTDCSHAYLGGRFSTVHGTSVTNIAEVDTSTGAVVSGFKHSAGGQVETMVGWHGHLLTGGLFHSINGSKSAPYFASLNPSTGAEDGYLRLNISGTYVYTDASGRHSASNSTKIYNQQLSHDGTKDLVEGVFTSIGGKARRQVAVVDLTSTGAHTDAWHAAELDTNCATSEPFYARGGGWSANDGEIYVATTGFKPASGPGFSTRDRRAGPCDAAIAYPATSANVSHAWINYTGCDSLYTAASDSTTAYFAGHERWASNPDGCDVAGPGAVSAPGIVGLSPSSGSVVYNPTRSRGKGADDLLVTTAGLWIASDTAHGATKCGHVYHPGICFFPYG